MLYEPLGTVIPIDGGRALKTTNGLVGIALYGPYIKLDPGRYIVAFQISALPGQRFDIDAVCAKIDVVSNLGKTTYAFAEIAIGQLRRSPGLFTLSFDLAVLEEVEFRVHVTGETSLLIDESTHFIKVSNKLPNDLSGSVESGFPDPTSFPKPTLFVHMTKELLRLYERGVDFEMHETNFILHYQEQLIEVNDHNDIDSASRLWKYGAWTDVSYAQMREDVTLLRALKDVSRDDGFYIDIGANDPTQDSVTKLFYDRGWRGINVEPLQSYFYRLTQERPRDVNIQAAVTEVAGEIEFYDVAGSQLSTTDPESATRHKRAGITTISYIVPALTLTEICEQHASKDIHFLKIDVEGHEGPVIRGLDFTRFRPWILVVEATEPMNFGVMTHSAWEATILGAGYRLVWMDLPNRYYVALERAELSARFDGRPDHYLRMER